MSEHRKKDPEGTERGREGGGPGPRPYPGQVPRPGCGPASERGSGPDSAGRGGGRSGSGPAGLPEELRALGRSLGPPGGGPDVETMVERVLGQILAERIPTPAPEPPTGRERLADALRWTRRRWRSLTAALCGLLAVLVLTPPVRAAVVDWFGFGGVEVRYDPSAPPAPDAPVPGCAHPVTAAEAERRAGFAPVVPPELGEPDAVSVTAETEGRAVVSLCWTGREDTVRLDQFPAELDHSFTKTVRERPEWVQLTREKHEDREEQRGQWGLWFPRAHLLSFWMVDPTGERWTRRERTAGPTLLWTAPPAQGPAMTLRLEGVTSRERAVGIARSSADARGQERVPATGPAVHGGTVTVRSEAVRAGTGPGGAVYQE